MSNETETFIEMRIGGKWHPLVDQEGRTPQQMREYVANTDPDGLILRVVVVSKGKAA